MQYQATIGLEVHIELQTKSKMFCGCRNDPQEQRPNWQVCPICMGHPGVLPVINEEAVKKAVKTALALNCQIQPKTHFERKNYFYPDLPKGYQISQYKAPLGKEGYLEIPRCEEVSGFKKSKIKNQKSKTQTKNKKIRIERIHLEEDTGKLIHPEGTDYSLVDFNRAGVPLMELVTEPDISSAREARLFAKELQLILRYLRVSEADMEKGEMRIEVNISMSSPGAKKLGTKAEIKNLNSLRAVEKAIDYEIKRQSAILARGDKVVQETRGWHDKRQITFSQREKEESHDYRYFPEPDLPWLDLPKKFIESARVGIPELPSQKRERFKKEYYLTEKEIEAFVSTEDLGAYFEKVVSELREWVKAKRFEERVAENEFKKLTKITANYILTELLGLCGPEGFRERACKITPENFAEFVSMLLQGEISSKIAKTLLKEMFLAGGDPSQIIERRGLKQITDKAALKEIVKEVIKKNPKPVGDYQKGKEAALQFLVGQVMKATKGKASPEIVNKLLKKSL